MNPVMWGIIAAAAAATVWHAVAEHHVHRRLLRRFRPGTAVPQTTHDTWWHSLPRSHRITVQAALTTAGLAAGIAYETVPTVAIAVLAGTVVAGIVLLAARTSSAWLPESGRVSQLLGFGRARFSATSSGRRNAARPGWLTRSRPAPSLPPGTDHWTPR